MANYTAADIKALRERTGAGMLDVKKALDEADGDAQKAQEIIRVKGLKGVTKREGRSTAEGIVLARTENNVGYMVEVNSETDFVAKSAPFVEFGNKVLDAAVAADAADLDAYDLGGFRAGGLICWEHWMPLPRHVLHAGGEQVHVAAWPHGKERHQLASRHYAFEGRTFVLAAALWLTRDGLPADFEMVGDLDEVAGEDGVIHNGGSAVVAPDGSYVVEPVFGREELVVAELDLGRVVEEKLNLDVTGHYSRPDLFDLTVRRQRLEPWREAE